jgi:hypothetical protein
VGADDEEAIRFVDVEAGTWRPVERGDDGAIGYAAPAVHGGQPVDDLARVGRDQVR